MIFFCQKNGSRMTMIPILQKAFALFLFRIYYCLSGQNGTPINMKRDVEHMASLTEFCASGSKVTEQYLPTDTQVALRMISFQPAQKSSNPPLIFVSGWISLMAGWKEVLHEMTRDFQIFYLETREKNSSRVQGKVAYSVEALGQDVVQVVNALNLKEKNYLLLGSSLGATVILDCYRRLKQKPLALILVAPNAVFRVPWWGKMLIRLFYTQFYFVLKPFIKWYLRKFRLNVNSDPEQYRKYARALDAADPYKLKKAALAFASYQVWEHLPAIDCPVLLVGGSADKLHEPQNLQKIRHLLPEVTYIDLQTNKRAHTALLVKEIRTFLKKLGESRA